MILKRFRAAPLSSSFFFAAILGFVLSGLYYQFGKLSADFAISFMILFGVMFVASMISMTKAPIETLTIEKKGRVRVKE